MITLSQIKKDHSAEIARFLKNGGQIKPAVNSNKAYNFNFSNPDEIARNAEKPDSIKNHELRVAAKNKGLKSYTSFAPCKSCNTSARSVKSNACLECDRRRARSRLKHSKNIDATILDIATYLVEENKTFEFTIKGKKYTLKAEEV